MKNMLKSIKNELKNLKKINKGLYTYNKVLNKSWGIATTGLARKEYRNMFFYYSIKDLMRWGKKQYRGKGELKNGRRK